ncbi:MAG TPA: hypothetical protein PKI11_15875, partial [Candidatus Hydrogenedentes bacterium]|nr:hypothetical protein [Candidatus Hydrogenedentota bacterium]
ARVPSGAPGPGGDVKHEVWRDPKTGRRAIVLTNTARNAVPVAVEAFEGGRRNPVRIVAPFADETVARLPVEVSVPGERFALVVEDPEARPAPVARRKRGAAKTAAQQPADPTLNFGFERGDLTGWQEDGNWTVDDNSAGGWYAGWQGRWFAWSGKGGEEATGALRSNVFVLDKEGVEVLAAGWADVSGVSADRWNYVTLNLEDGTEIDRVYAPNTTLFTPLILDGPGHRGARVYVEAVDDAPHASYAMLCIDTVQTVALSPAPSPGEFDPADHIPLENDHYRIEARRDNGVIARIYDKTGELDLILEPRLADNFVFTLPIVGEEAWTNTEANRILGAAQRLTGHTLENDRLTLRWGGPLASVFGVFYDVAVEMTVALAGDQVNFGLTIDNRTDLKIGEVFYPIIGGTLGLGKFEHERRATVCTVPTGAAANTQSIYRTFNNMTPFGELYPEQLFVYPHTLSMPWMQLYSPRRDRGVYFAAHDPVRRVKAVQLIQVPGIASNRADGNWPRPEELDGAPAGVAFNFVHMAYHPARETFEAAPVVLRFHDGGVGEAARHYGAWFAKTFGPLAPAATAPLAFRECGRIAFAELAQEARQARADGRNALLLNDWKTGGQGNGIPDFTPDPDLGGAKGLAAAVRACRESGVQVFLRFNLQPVDPDTAFHKKHNSEFVCADRWGVPFTDGPRRRVWLNPGAAALRARLVDQVRPLARSGVGGLFIADFFTDKIDCNPVAGMTPDRADWDGGMKTLEALRDAGRAINPDFRLVTNAIRDHLTAVAAPAGDGPPVNSPFAQAMPHWLATAAGDAIGH